MALLLPAELPPNFKEVGRGGLRFANVTGNLWQVLPIFSKLWESSCAEAGYAETSISKS